MHKYRGSCHCGAITYNFTSPEIDKGLRCNCSICVRKGAVMTAFTISPDDIDMEIKDGSLSTYQFGSKSSKHHFCKQCGIYTFHETKSKLGHFRLNIGCIDGINSLEIPVGIFDGAAI